MLSERERGILLSVSHGRNSLDHFVDQFRITCSEALRTTESLIERGYLRKWGLLYLDSLSFALTEEGEQALALSPEEQPLREARVSKQDLLLLSHLRRGAAFRGELEAVSPEEDIASQLAHLSDTGYIAVRGFFRGQVALTARGRELLERLTDHVPAAVGEVK